MSIKKLVSQTATYGLTTIIVRFINYFLTPYFTNLAIFTRSVYGVMGYYYSIIPFGLTLLSMGLETGYFRFVGKCETQKEKDKIFNTLLSTVGLISILFFIIVTSFTDKIYILLEGEKAGNKILIPIVAAIIAVDVIMSMPFAKLRYEGKTRKFMYIKVANVVVNIGFCLFFYSILPILSSKGILTSLWDENFGSGYVFVANLIASFTSLAMISGEMRGYKFTIDKKILRTIFIFSLPLFISGLSGTANEFIDRQLLYFLLPGNIATAEIGIYTAIMKIAAFIYLFIQMYRYAAEPYFLSEVKNSDFKERNAQALKYFTIASLSIFLFITLFIDYFQYFIGKEFRVGLQIVPVLLLSNVLVGIYLNLSYWYKVSEKTYFAVIISLAGLIITIALNILLIPLWGYVGAAWARLGCEAAMVILSYILNQKFMPVNYDIKSIGKYALLVGMLYGGFSLLDLNEGFIKTSVAILFFITFVGYFVYQEKLFKRYIK
ncbi:MAG: oligosaccharide flippase family protein [Rikenellaceae bacterium]